jgi:catechol 2,3-dioxygenase-like lactoylglutathione lyase family enzyme
MTAPRLDGIHHVKLPVRDLAPSRAWYESRLGCQAAIEFAEQGNLMGISMRHRNGGPELALSATKSEAGFDQRACERSAGGCRPRCLPSSTTAAGRHVTLDRTRYMRQMRAFSVAAGHGWLCLLRLAPRSYRTGGLPLGWAYLTRPPR